MTKPFSNLERAIYFLTHTFVPEIQRNELWLKILRLRSGFRLAARFSACPEAPTEGPRKRLKFFPTALLAHHLVNIRCLPGELPRPGRDPRAGPYKGL